MWVTAYSQCLYTNSIFKYTPLWNKIDPTEESVYIQSEKIIINYPEKITFSGNVNLSHNHHTLTSDELILHYNKQKNVSYDLYANGHINYDNNQITLTGKKAWINLNNKNANIYNGTFYLKNSHIHGVADIIMQREHNRYTIIKNGYFTYCPIHNDHWKITSSNIIFDYYKNSINIWNAKFKIKKIPIFYSPYLFLFLNKNNILTSYIPTVKYSNIYGLIIKIPYPIYFSKYCFGNISPYYISNIGIILNAQINYSTYPGTGLIIFNIIKKNKNNINIKLNKNYSNASKILRWKHNTAIHKKWYLNVCYNTIDYNSNIYDDKNHSNNTIYINTINNNINKKFICRYNNKNWNIHLTYLSTVHNTKRKNKYHNYTIAPQLTLNSYHNFYIQKIPFTIKTINQITKFIPENYSYPKAIRIHTEPIICCTICNNYQHTLNIETKLKYTHYQQKNINHHNTKLYTTPHRLQNKIDRIVPQFKIYGNIILNNITNDTKKNKKFVELELQYLYIPYCFQNNIGIYDSSPIYIDHNNLFNDSIYSGLDRIAPANKITSNIVTHYINNAHEIFYLSIGQIYNLSQHHLQPFNIIQKQHPSSISTLFSGVSRWNINNHWNIHTEIQYNTQYQNVPFGTVILEYLGKNNYTLQTHYRYINAQYIQQLLSLPNKSVDYITISQLGLFTYIPIYNNWKIIFSHYCNIKTKKLINRTIGIQHYTDCWNINVILERKIIKSNKKHDTHLYDNRIKLNIKISNFINNSQSNLYKTINKNMLP